ncbi:MAG: hypothetical protein NT059_00615 [Planctomycetota bacterium]|nr:hypothetical protein [Planctomycetota bacterium]
MTEYPPQMTPEQAARNRRVILWVAVVFVLVCISVSVWGFTVTRASRERAKQTDSALRSVAWSILCYASSNDGAFPVADGAIAISTAGMAPPAGKPWPSSLDSAMGGLPPMAIGTAREIIGITWGATSDVVPNLNTKGLPSTFGTVETVNGWMAEYAREKIRERGQKESGSFVPSVPASNSAPAARSEK